MLAEFLGRSLSQPSSRSSHGVRSVAVKPTRTWTSISWLLRFTKRLRACFAFCIYARRIVGCDRDHRDSRGATTARGPVRSRGRATHELPEQHQATWFGAAQLRVDLQDVPALIGRAPAVRQVSRGQVCRSCFPTWKATPRFN
jgi:hypothetical protein